MSSAQSCTSAGDVQLQRMDLVLTVGTGLNGAGGADQVAWAWKWMGAEALFDVDRGEAGEGDSLGVADDEVGVAVAVGVNALDVDDAPYGFAAGGVAGWAVRGNHLVISGRPPLPRHRRDLCLYPRGGLVVLIGATAHEKRNRDRADDRQTEGAQRHVSNRSGDSGGEVLAWGHKVL